MGWNEADEEEYVITEDDMKEFQNLSKQVGPVTFSWPHDLDLVEMTLWILCLET